MDHGGEPQNGDMDMKPEELTQMDGSCDACEPDEAQPATQVCHICSFAFCPVHAVKHANSTRHKLMPYSHEGTQANSLGMNGAGHEAEGVAMGAAGGEVMTIGSNSDDPAERSGGGGAQNCSPEEAELGEGAEGSAARPEGVDAAEPGKRDTVTVERLRCEEHGQEGSLYCKPDEKIICVVCAVQGEHREHEIITLREAYAWQKHRQGYDLLGCTQQMAEKIKTKWSNPEMSTEELEEYVNSQFDELRRLVRLEEKRFLHLVDLKEAFLTASAAEKIAEITVETEKLQEEMASITHQLSLLEKAEGQGVCSGMALEVLAAQPAPAHRMPANAEARPRLPEPRADPVNTRDFKDDSEPSMDHAP
ncbi:tripartite motif-containing protein 44 isoform 1-T5 [Pholidichthys leucotaenia]